MKLIYLLFAATLSACAMNGTDVGNAFSPGESANDCGANLYNSGDVSSSCVQTPYIFNQVSRICKKLGDVQEIDKLACYDSIMQQPGLSSFLQVKQDTYFELEKAYRAKEINVDSEKYGVCLRAIEEANPSDPIFQSAFDINNPTRFDDIHNILKLDASCVEVYEEK